jgi:hypothetical protein
LSRVTAAGKNFTPTKSNLQDEKESREDLFVFWKLQKWFTCSFWPIAAVLDPELTLKSEGSDGSDGTRG